jgi:hypothetical protein
MKTDLELQTADIFLLTALAILMIIAVRIVIGFFGDKKK